MRRFTQAKLMIGLTVPFALALGTIALHVADRFTKDGQVNGDAIGFLVTYWVVGLVLIALAFNFRRRWKEVLLLVTSLVMTWAVAEFALRLAEVPGAMRAFQGINSRLYHHLYPPNTAMHVGIVEGKAIVVKTNEDGLRTSYSRREFERFTNRIAVLGDSFTFGSLVRQENVFPAVMEKVLRTRATRNDVAVLNAGVISYSPLLEERLYAGIVKHYAPTLVLLVLDATDIGDDVKYAGELRSKHGCSFFDVGNETTKQLGFHSAVGRLASVQVAALERFLRYPFDVIHTLMAPQTEAVVAPPSHYNYYEYEIPVDGTIEHNRFFIYRHPLKHTQKYFMNTLTNINRLAEGVHAAGGHFVLVVTPRFHHWNADECPANWEKDEYALNEPYQFEYFRFFDEAATWTDYRIVNLLPAFRACGEFPLVLYDDPHWNERGHAFVGRTLAEYIVAEHLLQ